MRARFLGAVRRGEVRKVYLDLTRTKITTAASMRELWGAVWQGNAATLEELDLGGSECTDAAVPELQRLPRLTVLNLAGSRRISAAACLLLAELPWLVQLNLDVCNGGLAAEQALKERLNTRRGTVR